jgi:hypothetical protein
MPVAASVKGGGRVAAASQPPATVAPSVCSPPSATPRRSPASVAAGAAPNPTSASSAGSGPPRKRTYSMTQTSGSLSAGPGRASPEYSGGRGRGGYFGGRPSPPIGYSSAAAAAAAAAAFRAPQITIPESRLAGVPGGASGGGAGGAPALPIGRPRSRYSSVSSFPMYTQA